MASKLGHLPDSDLTVSFEKTSTKTFTVSSDKPEGFDNWSIDEIYNYTLSACTLPGGLLKVLRWLPLDRFKEVMRASQNNEINEMCEDELEDYHDFILKIADNLDTSILVDKASLNMDDLTRMLKGVDLGMDIDEDLLTLINDTIRGHIATPDDPLYNI